MFLYFLPVFSFFPEKISSGRLSITLVSGGTLSVSQILPPMIDRLPITVSPPRIMALA
jgi:hypothetical protein